MAMEALTSPTTNTPIQFPLVKGKRSRRPLLNCGNTQEEQLALCLIMLARGGGVGDCGSGITTTSTDQTKSIYKCGICDRGFSSYQALGGHKSSHRKPSSSSDGQSLSISGGAGPGRVHECSICYRRFPTGQALGGHKRCHYAGSSSGGTATSTDGGGSAVNHRNFDLNFPAFPEEEEVESPHPAKKLRLLFPVKYEHDA